MISIIEIKNFRCFEHTKISGFKRVNLIGGLNNSGKTALLEALYLNNSPTASSIIALSRFRKQDIKFFKALPKKAWNSFFFNQNIEQNIEIETQNNAEILNTISLSCDDEKMVTLTIQYDPKYIEGDITVTTIKSDETLDNDKYEKSVLHIYKKIIDKKNENISSKIIASLEANSEEVISEDSKDIILQKKVHFIPASSRISGDMLAQEFDIAYLNDYYDNILNAIKIIDPSVSQIRTLTVGEPNLYLKTDNGNYLPISLFGEAISKVTYFILRILNKQNKILLIDEIENGIHYTNQPKLWEMLFKLAIEFDIQIFATTHSIEMIRAFSETAKNFDEDMAAYIEMTRSVKSGRIVGIARDMDQLDYEINQGIGVRGE